MVALDFSYFKIIKRFRVQVSIPFIAKDIAIIRLSLNGGSHLEFSLDEKKKNCFFESFRVNISKKCNYLKSTWKSRRKYIYYIIAYSSFTVI